MLKWEKARGDEETSSPVRFRAEAAPREFRDSSKPVGADLSPTRGESRRKDPAERGEMVQKGGDNKGEDEMERKTRGEGGREEARRRGETEETKGGKRS